MVEAILINIKPLGFVRLHGGRSVYNDKTLNILKRFFYFKKIRSNPIFKELNTFYKKNYFNPSFIWIFIIVELWREEKKQLFLIIINQKK